ncbi:MAG: LysM peptidoglycan-binding domain-containing protein [Prevotellaceae bacterium]|nr:LysM peptidoglycan-binding domain-containing protein [Prevotellaceae bacterium]
MRSIIKKCLLAVVLALVSEFAFAQQVTVSHIVAKGETLESIATRYNTTAAAIIELNPEAEQVVYVGMELKIPVTAARSEGTATASPQAEEAAVTVPTDQAQGSTADSFKHWDVIFRLALGYLPKPSGIDYQVSVGMKYAPIEQLYIGLMVGYNGAEHFKKGTFNSNMIYIPIEVDGKFKLNNGHHIGPYIGVDLNICVKANYDASDWPKEYRDEIKKSMEKELKGKLGADFRLGFKYGVGKDDSFIGAAMVVPINDNQKGLVSEKVYPEITFGFGF